MKAASEGGRWELKKDDVKGKGKARGDDGEVDIKKKCGKGVDFNDEFFDGDDEDSQSGGGEKHSASRHFT